MLEIFVTKSDETTPKSDYHEGSGRIRERVQTRDVVMDDRAWQVLGGLEAWQITEFPRRPRARQNAAPDQDRADLGTTQRVQALVSAFHYGEPVAFGWMREHAGGPVRVLAAGPALAGAAGPALMRTAGPSCVGGADVLTLPAGARAQALPPGQVPDLLARMPCWMRLAGITDALLAGRGDPGPVSRDARPSLEDGLLSAWSGPFAWLVLAEPASAGELHDLAAEVSLAQLSTQRSDAPPAQLAAQRLSARHAELRQATATGLWKVRVVAGGPSPSGSAQIAGLLCASTDLEGLPYALAPVPGCAGLAESLRVHAELTQRAPLPRVRDEPDIPAPAAPFYASSRLVAALARPPARELPGIRLVLRPDFDVTPETAVVAGDGSGPPVPAGTVLDWNRVPAGELAVSRASLNRHVFVCGATGAGESQVIRIRPGELGDPPAGINPLEPAPGPDGVRFPLQTHADLVRALFLAAFDADEPFPQVLAAALTRCYERAGWDLVTGEPATPGLAPGYPALEDLQDTAIAVVDEIGYGREITDNVRGFVTVRISSLRQGTTGRFLQGGHPLDFGALLAANVVLEIEEVGDDRDKAFLMGTVLIRLAEHLRLRARAEGPGAPRLRHLSVFEEAHRLLRQPRGTQAGAAAHAVEMFAGLLAEIRAYGEGLVIAEQIPSKLVPDVIKNTAVKIVHRLPAADDRESVGATMNLTEEQSAYLVTLVPGQAAVFTDGMDYPLLTRMPDGTSREVAGPAPAASPSALITPRSLTCGPECRPSPCTLRQIRGAQRAATGDPRITVWAELSVLAHLTGWLMPMPGPALAAALTAMTSRLRDCALSHAIDAAVAARIPVISARISGAALAVHVTAAMDAALDDGRWLCDQQEPQWLAPPYRWALVLDSLQAHHRRDPGAGPHPRTAEWEAAYARAIPGPTCASQLQTVQRWYDTGQRDHQQVRAVSYGTRPASAIERAVGARAADQDWEQRLTDALTAFHDCRWPLDYLRPAAGT